MNDEILHLIALQGEMKCEFAKNTKKMINSNFTSNFSCACFDLFFSNLKLEWSDKIFKRKTNQY
jgi:hypothetical protein